MTDAVKVDGLAQFVRNLGKLDQDLPKAVRVALNEAAKVVVNDAQAHVPHRTGKAARSIRPQSTRTAVRVTEGGTRAKYMPWLDFGGRVGRNRSVSRPFLPKGRYIYKSYFAKRDSGEFQDAMSKALLNVVESAGIAVD